MRKIELNTIEIGEEAYPLYCDLYVLSKIQEKMSVNEFERRILGAVILRDNDGNPTYDENNHIKLVFDKYDIDTIIFGLTLMINEGLQIRSDQEGEEYEEVDEKYIARMSTLPIEQISDIIHNEFNRCFNVKKNTVKTTKNRSRKTSR